MLKGFAYALVSLFVLCGCAAQDLLRDPSVERWCGDTPCEWQTAGTIKRVGTWHKFDYAIELISDDAQVWQDNATITAERSRCFKFGMVAKVAPEARVFLELDFLADGTAELSQRLPVSDWKRLSFLVTTPDWYKGVRFRVRKDGPGEVVLAELSAVTAPDQCSAPPVELLDRPDGARCNEDRECTQGQCERGACAGCGADADCVNAGEICGLLLIDKAERHACVQAGSASFGVVCGSDSQCESGICEERACSECRGSTCDEGKSCAPARRTDTNTKYWPKLCDPGSRTRAKGELCTADSDCGSGHCVEQDACTGEQCEPVLTVGMCS